MQTDAPSRPTCPHCAATVRPGMQWCSLCYGALPGAGVRPVAGGPTTDQAARATTDATEVLPADARADAATTDAATNAATTDAATTDAATTDAATTDAEAHADADVLVDAMLARLAATGDDPVGLRLPRSTPARVALVAGAGLAGALALLVVLSLLGLLL